MAFLAALLVQGLFVGRAIAAEEDGVAVAIVYDSSGSMTEPVADITGKSAPKHVIAERALAAVVKRLQAFALSPTSAGAPRRMKVGLYCFSEDGAKEIVKFGPFDPGKMDAFICSLPHPNGGTPLGNALITASQMVLKSGLSRKHVLIITDGVNTVGPDPAKVLPGLKDQAAKQQAGLSVHFVAFDVDAKLFNPLRKLGATVVGAADESQLNIQLGLILEKKILLEDEEPAQPSKTK
ncbi:MAG: VWA domain-containing protein [Opitutaceae bacterium]